VIKLTLSEVAQALGAKSDGLLPACNVAGVSTDTRSLRPGELFFAIRGPSFDGHDYVIPAIDRGAPAVVVAAEQADRVRDDMARTGGHAAPILAVDDPVAAMGRLAAFHRTQLATDVIAVVGSNGKTTTKAMIDHVLSGSRKGRSSPKSFNNAIGVPLTLLSAEAGDDYLVVEIGTNAPGEIAQLAAIVKPDMVVLTSIGEEHLEGLGDLRGVAAEECAAFRHIREGGFAAINIDAAETREHLPKSGPTVVTFGRCADADLRVTPTRVTSTGVEFDINGKFSYRVGMSGIHNAVNAAGAIAVARRLGMEHEQIAERLAGFSGPPMRHEVLSIGGVTIINDAYNANPASALAALDTLQALGEGGRKVLVFGEMRELGERSREMHERVARRLCGGWLSEALLVGAAAELMLPVLRGAGDAPPARTFETVNACAGAMGGAIRAGDVVLLKASRAVGLERLIAALRCGLEAAGRTEPTPVKPTVVESAVA